MFKTLSDLLEKSGIRPSEEEVEVFRLHTRQIFFSPGDLLAKEGFKNSKIYFVNNGIVRTVMLEHQKEITEFSCKVACLVVGHEKNMG